MPDDEVPPFSLMRPQPDAAHEGMRVEINAALQQLRDQQDAIEVLILDSLGGL